MPPVPAIDIAILTIIISITVPAVAAYGKLRDDMATFRAEIVSLKVTDLRNTKDIEDECRRNDHQDIGLAAVRELLARIDSNVQRLVTNDESQRRNLIGGSTPHH
jgi:CRISPR/Cas system-associated endonuclease Cas1